MYDQFFVLFSDSLRSGESSLIQSPVDTQHKFKPTQQHDVKQEQQLEKHSFTSNQCRTSYNREKTTNIETIPVIDQKYVPRTNELNKISNERRDYGNRQQRTQKEEPVLYYVPPKKSKPGIPMGEGSYVQIPRHKEETSEVKKSHQKSTIKKGNHVKEPIKTDGPVSQILISRHKSLKSKMAE